MAKDIEELLRRHLKSQYPELTDIQIEERTEEYRAVAHLILRLAEDDVAEENRVD